MVFLGNRRLISLLDKLQLRRYLVQSQLLEYLSVQQVKQFKYWTEQQHYITWRELPGHRHGKLFIGRPCRKTANHMLKLSRHQLKMVAAILTGHTTVRGQLYIMGV